MRGLVLCVFLFSVVLAARAEDLMGSDRNAYGREVRLSAATLDGDRYATVTGRVLMEGTLAAPARLFSDVAGLPGWIDNLVAVQEIEARGPTDRTVYMRYAAPAGLADRDGVMRFVAVREAPTVITLRFEDMAAFAPATDAVRMTDVRGRFRVEQVAPGVLAVEFRLHYDSAARPVVLANLSVKRQVQQTLVRMRHSVEVVLRNASLDAALAQALDRP